MIASTLIGLLCVSSIVKAESKELELSTQKKPSEENLEKNENKFFGKSPLFFAVEDAVLSWKRSGISYDFRKSNEVEVGSYKVKANSFKASMVDGSLDLQWDPLLVLNGQLSVFDRLGNTVFTQNMSHGKAMLSKDIVSQWGDQQRLRFCIKSSEEREFSSLCSAWYGVSRKDDLISLKEHKGDMTSQLIIQNEERARKGFVEVAPKDIVQFFVRLKNEVTFEFVAQLPEIEVLDLVTSESEKDKEYRTVFFGATPLEEKKELISNPLYTRRLPKGSKLWGVWLPQKQRSINFQGDQGGFFTYDYNVENPPTEKDRVYISERFSLGTYNRKDKVRYDSESGQGVWEFQSPDRGWGRIDGSVGNSGYKSYLEVYRGKPGEVGLRVAALMTTQGGQAVVGEGYAGYWFNSLFGSENYYLSRQRWGVAITYLSALTSLSTEVEDDIKYSNLSALLKYKIKPGIAYHDSSWGLQVGYTQAVIGEFDVPLFGAGLFWSDQLPSSVGELLEKLSIFRKPKWLGVEAHLNFTSLDAEIKLDGSSLLRGYLRTFISDNAYWELSGGFRDNSFSRDNGAAIKLNTLSGSIGIGANF